MGLVLCLGEGAVKEENFVHSETPSWAGSGGASEPQRRAQKQVRGRQNREFDPEISADQHFPAKKLFACPLQQLGAGC